MTRTRFNLFSSHIDLAHQYWTALVKEGDIVIDATSGNGYDTLILAKLNPKKIYALDIQPQAIESSKELIAQHLSENEQKKIKWVLASHKTFPKEIEDKSVKIIVYNLGYLPGGDKAVVTDAKTTLESLKNGLPLLMSGGTISLTFYPGHRQGKEEEDYLLEYARKLNPKEWSCCHHQWLNRNESPSLLIIQRSV